MFRRAVLVADQKSPGYWHNSKYSIVEELLDKAKVTRWTKAGVIGNVRESRKIAKETATAASDYNADLLHITNQEFAMFTPKNSDIPVIISVDNLFDFRPRSMDAGDVIVPLGDRNPSSAKLRKLEAIKAGIERADLLICDSEITLSDARLMFPGTKSVMIRCSIDTDFWDPSRNPKNPDLLEYLRGKTGTTYGNLFSMLTILKGLPLSYFKDLQDDKEFVFTTFDTLINCLKILDEILNNFSPNKKKMLELADSGYITATDLADYLVQNHSMTFRSAYEKTATIVNYAEKNKKKLEDLNINELKKIEPRLSNDVLKVFNLKNSVNSKRSYGGTAFDNIKKMIIKYKKQL